jgi:SAM-dependent methyltransferase
MQTFLSVGLSAGMLLTGVMPLQANPPNINTSPAQTAIPYVPTRHDAVRDLLWLADVGTNDVVYDLGSGDGRVVIAAIRDFHVRKAVGIEINPQLIRESRENTAQAGVAGRVEFIQGDLFTNDFSQASVVVLYLGHGANLDLRAQLVRTLKPGTRVVSHQFGMGEWTADKTLDVRTAYLGMHSERFNSFTGNPDVPEFGSNGRFFGHDFLSVWIVPAPVAGVWRGKTRMGGEEGELKLTLHQRLTGVTGSFQFQGPTNLEGAVWADLWGDHLRFHCMPGGRSYGGFLMWFDGHVKDDTMNGSFWVSQGDETREFQWAGRRDKVDFTGTWEWTGPMDSPVQLKIERRDGRLTATYVDTNRTALVYLEKSKPIPVTDFYDFGGGFYFTLLLGLEGNSITMSGRRAGPEDGWLIGEGIATSNTLSGTIAFYPYHQLHVSEAAALVSKVRTNAPGSPDKRVVAKEGRCEWLPKRVAP